MLHPSLEMGAALIERLTAQGDEVRVIERDPQLVDHWRALGAFVAHGSADDPDLVERAAHSCRTMVLLDVEDGLTSTVESAIAGARSTTIDRVVMIAGAAAPRCLGLLRAGSLDYVFVRAAPQRSLFGRRSLDLGFMAEVVDAADDLAGDPRLELDLSDPAARRALGLGP
ncbi:MAG: TrkA-N domain [Actinomycetota bacterium]|nr:TrkA-N domain [Actinomycetota bacterium]